MGAGINIGCKCHSKLYMLGIGMMFPDVYKKTVEMIKAGKFGEEGKNIMHTIKYAVVDIEDSLYLCEKCGNLTQAKPMDYYAPKDENKAAKEEYGIKTVEEWGEVPYWAPYMDFDNNYKLIKKTSHKCSECKNEMIRVDEEKIRDMKCPKCGEKYEVSQDMLWD